MDKENRVKHFARLNKYFIQKYERYLPTAFDESLTLLEKVNKIIEGLNTIVRHINDQSETLEDWQTELLSDLDTTLDEYVIELTTLKQTYETFRNEILDDILPESTSNILNKWLENGTLEQIINENVFNMKADKTYVDTQLAKTEERSYSRALLSKHQKPSIVWIDDDGLNLAFERLAPHARNHNIPMAFAVVTSWLDNGSNRTFSREEVIEKYREGFEILDHSYAHDSNYRPTQMTSEELREDLTKTKQIWADLGIPNNIHVIPFGANTPTTTNIYREFFDASIMTTLEENGGVPNFLPLNNFRLGRISYNSPLEHILEKIDEAVDNNGLIIIMSHMGVDDYNEDKVNAIITNAKSKGLEWITMQEALNRFGNIANFGNVDYFNGNIIQADGTMTGDIGNKITSTLGSSLPINAPISYFKEKTTTSFTVSNPQAESYGLPINEGGYIDTVRAQNDGYSYQFFVSWRTGEIRLRKWNHNENEWGDWRTTGTTLASDNNFNLNTQPNRFDYGTTYSLIDASMEEGSPEGNNGTLITHKTTSGSFIGRTFQEYHANTTTLAVYKRRAMSNTTWSDWKKVSV